MFETRLSESARQEIEDELRDIFDQPYHYGYGGSREFPSYLTIESIVDLIENKMVEAREETNG